MKFEFIDRIVELLPGESIRTRKSLTLAEDYLADHFPSFPVMPGVLMLECLAQSAAWLVQASDDFAHSLVWLEEARNVVYKSFLSPGEVLEVTVRCKARDPQRSAFDGWGYRGSVEIVKARFWLRHCRTADVLGAMDGTSGAVPAVGGEVDRALIARARERFAVLGGPAALRPVPAASS